MEEVQREPGSMKAQNGISLSLCWESRAHVFKSGGGKASPDEGKKKKKEKGKKEKRKNSKVELRNRNKNEDFAEKGSSSF